MKIGIMQPYFFPYIGYFQLINEVDKFVIYDDVNFIKGGWINRNRILLNNQPHYINLLMTGASSNKKINEIGVNSNKNGLLETIKQAYRKSPQYKEVYPVIEEILNYNSSVLSEFIANSLIVLSDYLELKTEFIMSSDIKKDNFLKGQEKVISICKLLNADVYVNSIGGYNLYSKSEFQKRQIQLKFLQGKTFDYVQNTDIFHSNLSIIDVLMLNNLDVVKSFLKNYEIIENE